MREKNFGSVMRLFLFRIAPHGDDVHTRWDEVLISN